MDNTTLPQTLFTVQDLAALSSLVMAVYIIVSFLKDPLKALAKKITGSGDGDWIVRPVTVLIALSILVWLICVQGVITAETIGLAIINAFLVALIASAAHDYVVAPTKAKTSQLTVTELDEPVIYKPQVDDVSPPIITPQPSVQADSDPVAKTL